MAKRQYENQDQRTRVRGALAPYIGEPPPRSWVQRLRDVHPEVREALGDEACFENKDVVNDLTVPPQR